MNVTNLKSALRKTRKGDDVEALMRYVDTMGNTQTVPIANIIEEISRGDEELDERRVILIAGDSIEKS